MILNTVCYDSSLSTTIIYCNYYHNYFIYYHNKRAVLGFFILPSLLFKPNHNYFLRAYTNPYFALLITYIQIFLYGYKKTYFSLKTKFYAMRLSDTQSL